MVSINSLIAELIKIAEKSDDFYEVEVSVLVRRRGGLQSEFFRAQSQWSPELDEEKEADSESMAKWL
tara:strand:- start:10731 stop:10931 length:201 start_codon:yes stop_codon:yes gene_type:complete